VLPSLNIDTTGWALLGSHTMPDLLTPALRQAALISLPLITIMAGVGTWPRTLTKNRWSARAFFVGFLAGVLAVLPGSFLALYLLFAVSRLVAQIGADGMVASYYVWLGGGVTAGSLAAFFTSRALAVNAQRDQPLPPSQLVRQLTATIQRIDSLMGQLIEQKGHRGTGEITANLELARHVLSDPQMVRWMQIKDQNEKLAKARTLVHEDVVRCLDRATELLRELEIS